LKAKKLFDILPVGFDINVEGPTDIDIVGISIDSRQISHSYLYGAFKGTLSDGHNYIEKAIDLGATCIVCEHVDHKKEGITYIITNQVRAVLGEMAHMFFGYASEGLRLVGITGTNGKTTVSTLLYQLFSALGYKCGLISTVENRIGDEVIPATHTTPDVVNLHKLVSMMKDAKCDYVFMEVSSHAADQQRIAGLKFEGALFTNISHDHLDYHLTMKNYIAAKKLFFDHLPSSAFALVNADDKNGLVMVQNTKARKLTYGLRTMCDYKVKIIESSVQGLHLRINDREAYFRLIGEFNAYNLALVFGAARELGMETDDVLAILSGLRGAEGRFEQIVDNNTGKCGIVDYAHTPDALENVLETIHKVNLSGSKILTVVGCGGDRDATKRPVMAKVACTWSDKVIFKSDGMPTYHLANIVDDHLMKITHVIRGEEWLPSTPIHVLLYRFLGWESTMPQFAHLPLILKPDGNGKLSKRDGDRLGFPVFPLNWTSPETGEESSGFKERGFLPDAFVNMLAFLGWNPGTEQEIFTEQELINAFSIEHIGKSGAKFDFEKAKWFNAEYIKKLTDDALAALVKDIVDTKFGKQDDSYLLKAVGLVKERLVFFLFFLYTIS